MNKDEFNNITKIHNIFQTIGIEWLVKHRNAFIIDTAWHDKVIDQQLKNIISSNNTDLNTIVFRHLLPDNFVVIPAEKEDYFVTWIDWKALPNDRDPSQRSVVPNLAIDAVEYACHYVLATQLDCNVLYAYQNKTEKYDIEKGFFLSDAYRPNKVFYPQLDGDDVKRKQANFVRFVFPDAIEQPVYPKIGSSDPYVLINGSQIETMKHWHDLTPPAYYLQNNS